VYLSYYLDSNVFPNATPTDFAFIGGLNFSAAMVVSPIVTILTRKYGKHVTMGLGVIFQALGYGTASVAKQIWQLYLSQGMLVGLGTGFLYIPSTAILSQWFSKKRSLANGISAAGSGIGGVIFAWATGSMIEQLSLGWALRVTCFVGLTCNTIATALMRDRNKEIKPPQLPLDLRLLRRLDVWLLLSWAFVSMLGYIVLLYSLADFAIAIGLTRGQSTNIIGFLNLGTAVGRPIIGIWSDRFRRIDVAAIITLVCGISCFAFWLPATGYGLTVFFALLIGAILGVFWMVCRCICVDIKAYREADCVLKTIGPLCVEVAGLQDLPSLLSISWLTITIPTTGE
jgi:MFS family permease